MLAAAGLAHWVPSDRAQAATLPSLARELRIVTGPDSAAGRQIVQALKLRYPGMVAEGEPLAVTDPRRAAGMIPSMHVAVGPAGLRRALEAGPKSLLISVMTSSQVFRQLMAADAASPATSSLRDRPSVTAIYADAPPAAQLQLIASLFDGRVAVGALLSDASAHLERPMRQAASNLGIELLVERVAPSADVVRALTLLRGVQVLLAVPDSTLYTPDTLRSILESTYRSGMPVVGFSAGTVAAGTLATAYCATDDVMADLFDLIDGVGVGLPGPWPEPHFPRYWRVAVNESVARSLGVPLSDKVRRLGNSPAGRGE